MSDFCEDPNCEFYGEKLVDLGYGYPVCRSGRPRRYPISMDPKYTGFDIYYKVVKCNEGKEGKPRRK